ncbi:hypothetical protein D5R93_05860 [Actinomyces lilanjuaniae]|uniref:ParB-like N-terminal domain-containing protein n=1 Tax=Actinomyces lilanjuaniae TaxID=2321394 RepID=A0ABN5PNQ3_9ACTO|nr:ParB N-terminal domain-containing protein [Actinomyces lilanjuaniae]AYD89694.1 hypothetical protein D5R93_05860 [Actinomyces lilanjuaniae]
MTLERARALADDGRAVLVEAGGDTSGLRVGDHVWAVPDALDPGHNVRTRLPREQRDRLVASVREDGVQHAILAYPTLTGLVVLDGHRRLDAARRAGLEVVPVHVVDETAGVEAVERTRRQLVLNETARNLTTGDRVRALALFSRSGMPQRRLRRIADREEVAAAVALDGSGTDVDALAQALPSLTLTDLAAVAGLAADEDCDLSEEDMVAELTRDPSAREQLIALWREQTRRTRETRLRREELEACGVRVLTRSEHLAALDSMSEARLLSVLADGTTGQPLDEAGHGSCPGHAVGIGWSFDQDGVVTYAYCIDPDVCGHLPVRSAVAARLRGEEVPDDTPRWTPAVTTTDDDGDDQSRTPPVSTTSTSAATEGDTEEVEEARDVVSPPADLHRRRSEAAAAERLRREFVIRMLRTGMVATTGLVDWAVGHLSCTCVSVRSLCETAERLFGADLVRGLAGTRGGPRRSASASRWVVALASACVEGCMTGDYWTVERAFGPDASARSGYLRALVGAGYELSEVERLAAADPQDGGEQA